MEFCITNTGKQLLSVDLVIQPPVYWRQATPSPSKQTLPQEKLSLLFAPLLHTAKTAYRWLSEYLNSFTL